jgi:hypothetical protein
MLLIFFSFSLNGTFQLEIYSGNQHMVSASQIGKKYIYINKPIAIFFPIIKILYCYLFLLNTLMENNRKMIYYFYTIVR